MQIKLFTAVKACIIHNGKMLILRESTEYEDGVNPGKFDIPGGRIIPGERFDTALHREVQEETGLSVTIGAPFHIDEWHPVVRGESWQIVGIFFLCRSESERVTLSRDHDQYVWIDPRDY